MVAAAKAAAGAWAAAGVAAWGEERVVGLRQGASRPGGRGGNPKL